VDPQVSGGGGGRGWWVRPVGVTGGRSRWRGRWARPVGAAGRRGLWARPVGAAGDMMGAKSKVFEALVEAW
jgi:hypothetical protein